MAQLDPCPFCGAGVRMKEGENPLRLPDDMRHTASVWCETDDCRAAMLSHASTAQEARIELLSRWNRRASINDRQEIAG